MQIDLDTKDHSELEKTKNLLRETGVLQHIVCAVETKNGYHIVYTKEKGIDHKKLYEYKKSTAIKKPNVQGKLTTDYIFSITNQPLIIIPGTIQGTFKAKFTDIFEE
jgi:hypothetical protein